MKISDFFKKTKLEKTVLIGFYGGGNYGDELLMEVLSNLFKKQGIEDLSIVYQTPQTFDTFHKELGYERVPFYDKKAVLKSILQNKSIVIGGGGLWGLDVNLNIFFLSTLLFISRWIFGKNVYLLGVGYYNSTNRLGHVSAFLAGKAATTIFARDEETLANFGRVNKHVYQDTDIAWYIQDLDLSAYQADLKQLEAKMPIAQSGKTLFVTLRRFNPKYKNNFTDVVGEYVQQNTDTNIIVSLMEPEQVDPEGFALLQQWQAKNKNITIMDFSYNPLVLYMFFKKYNKQLLYVGPQFHGLITAHLTNVPFLPIVYDNKSEQVLKNIGIAEHIPIGKMSIIHIDELVKNKVG